MNILIVSQYFWPEHFIINDLVIKMQELGHQISVYTGKPNYPDGALYEGYAQAGVQEELFADTIPVYRVPLRPRKKGGTKNLALNYFSFVYSGLKHAFGFSRKKQFDVIFVFAVSPITAVIPAIALKWLTKAHLSVWVQDLWPQSLEATGFVRNRLLLTLVSGLVRGIYYLSDSILAQSQALIPQIARHTKAAKVAYYPNSVIDNFAELASTATSLPAELLNLMETNCSVVFAGNLGAAQSLETVIAAAQLLKDLPDLKLVIVGSGSKLDWLKQQIVTQDLSNIILAGRFPASDMPLLFSKAQALLVTLKSDPLFQYIIPSKIQSYLAAGKPIIASLNGEGARVVAEAGAGYIGRAEQAEELAKNIKQLYHLPLVEREAMGKRGRAYFLSHFEMEGQSKRLIELFAQRINERGAR